MFISTKAPVDYKAFYENKTVDGLIVLNEKYQNIIIKKTNFLLNQLVMNSLFNFTDAGRITIEGCLIIGTSLVGLTEKHLFYLQYFSQGCQIFFTIKIISLVIIINWWLSTGGCRLMFRVANVRNSQLLESHFKAILLGNIVTYILAHIL